MREVRKSPDRVMNHKSDVTDDEPQLTRSVEASSIPLFGKAALGPVIRRDVGSSAQTRVVVPLLHVTNHPSPPKVLDCPQPDQILRVNSRERRGFNRWGIRHFPYFGAKWRGESQCFVSN
jgi:hypothetical protein